MPDALRPAVGSHVYGCDICQDVCPWNRDAAVSTDPAWQPRPAFDRVQVRSLAARSDDDLRQALKGSPMKRAKIEGLRRNLAVALDNIDALERERPG
jgi:epoxyqueuosine reductase